MPGWLRRWWDTFWFIWDLVDRLNLSLIAAGVGFFAMLALFPAMAGLVVLWGWFADPSQITTFVVIMEEVVPPQVAEAIEAQLAGVVNATSGGRAVTSTILSLAFAFWSARAGISALIRGLNACYEIGHRPTIWRRYLADFGVTITVVVLTFIAIIAVVLAPVVLTVLPIGRSAVLWAEAIRWAVAFTVVIVTLGIVYRFGPNRRGSRPRWITPGAVAATFGWVIVSIGFSAYLANFARYNEIYGSLGAAVALLMWFYLSAFVVLLGGALNAGIEQGGRARMEARMKAEDRAMQAATPPT